MNIVLINLYDSLPDEEYVRGRYTYLAERLGETNHNVKWISSYFHHGSKRYRKKSIRKTYSVKNVEICKIWAPYYFKNIGLKRLYNDYYISKRIIWELINSKNKIDLIIASTSPIILPNKISEYGKRHGIKVIIDVQDAYPFNLLSLVNKKFYNVARLFLFPVEYYARNTLANAAAVTSLSKTRLKQVLLLIPNKKKMAKAIYLNYKGTPSYKGKKNDTKKIKLVYIGALGKFYDFKTVFYTLRKLAEKKIEYSLDIIGEGPERKFYELLAKKTKLDFIKFHGFINFNDAKNIIENSDIGLVPIRKGWPPCIPNKPIDYFGLGIPILNSVEGELWDMVNQYDLGYNYQPGNVDEMINVMLKIISEKHLLNSKGYNCYRITKDLFSPDKIMDNFLSFIEKVGNSPA
jgi:glycosyltransferase involved in cell wall biosynthesis